MNSIENGGFTISYGLSTTNDNNNSLLVREPYQPQYASSAVTAFMGDINDSTFGDLGGSVFNFSVEQTCPGSFSNSVRADLYQSAPSGGSYTDPTTGSKTTVYYMGYFDLSPTGVLTFTRQVTVPTLTITRTGNSVTISFPCIGNATYSLIGTNASSLTAPRSTWPTLGSPILGNNGTTNFVDNTTSDGRVYAVTVH
jgi:hypothetical protein